MRSAILFVGLLLVDLLVAQTTPIPTFTPTTLALVKNKLTAISNTIQTQPANTACVTNTKCLQFNLNPNQVPPPAAPVGQPGVIPGLQVDINAYSFLHSKGDIVNPLDVTAQAADLCRVCTSNLIPGVDGLNAPGQPDVWRFCYSLRNPVVGGNTFISGPAVATAPKEVNPQGSIWANMAASGSKNVVFAVDARAWDILYPGQMVQTNLLNAVSSVLNAVGPLDFFNAVVLNGNGITPQVTPAINSAIFNQFVLPFTADAARAFVTWASPNPAPGVMNTFGAPLAQSFRGDPRTITPITSLLARAKQVLIDSNNNAKTVNPAGAAFSTCAFSNNIVLFTGKDLLPQEAIDLANLFNFANPTPFPINLFIVHPPIGVMFGNPQAPSMTTQLYILQCNLRRSVMVPYDNPSLTNIFLNYYSQFQPFVGITPPFNPPLQTPLAQPLASLQGDLAGSMFDGFIRTPQYVDVRSAFTVQTFLGYVRTIPTNNIDKTSILDMVCGLDQATAAPAAGTTPQIPTVIQPFADTGAFTGGVGNAATTFKAVVAFDANNLCLRRTLEPRQIDLDNAVRPNNVPCVFTQTYWTTAAGAIRFNRVAELVVAVFLNLLWFVLTWVHNPCCCFCCCGKKKVKQLKKQLNDYNELYPNYDVKGKVIDGIKGKDVSDPVKPPNPMGPNPTPTPTSPAPNAPASTTANANANGPSRAIQAIQSVDGKLGPNRKISEGDRDEFYDPDSEVSPDSDSSGSDGGRDSYRDIDSDRDNLRDRESFSQRDRNIQRDSQRDRSTRGGEQSYSSRRK